jgi:tetratricopeptide (TPR) repeat protein
MTQPKPQDAEQWYKLANKQNYDKKDYKVALSSYDQALKLNPTHYKAWYNRGNALRRLDRDQEAINSFEKVLELIGDFENEEDLRAKTWNNRGLALHGLRCYHEAITSFDKALEIKRDYHQAWNNRGLALHALKCYHEAITSFDKALEIKRDYHQAWTNRGNALRNLGRYYAAVDSYDEALRLTNNQYWQAWKNRGWALFSSWRYQEALDNWTEGLQKLQPKTYDNVHGLGFGELHSSKGRAQYLHSKQQPHPFSDWREAARSYQQALRFIAFQAFPYRHLEILQDLLKVYSALGESQTTKYQELLEKGTQQLEELLRDCQSEEVKISLEQKFASFNQLLVDTLAQSLSMKKRVEALEIAEKRKNTCLSWLRQGWGYVASSPNYQQMQQLLNPQTAVIYWHVSPAAITTFIVRYNKPLWVWTLKPTTQISQLAVPDGAIYLPAIRQLEQFEGWMATWRGDYETSHKDEAIEKEDGREGWREQMLDRL